MTTKETDYCPKENARNMLLKYCPRNTTIYTTVRSVAPSGMSRRIDLYAVYDGKIVYLSGYYLLLEGKRVDEKKPGIKINGAGMDTGFELVCRLSYTLYGEEGALNQNWL